MDQNTTNQQGAVKSKWWLIGALCCILALSLGFGAGCISGKIFQTPDRFVSLKGNDYPVCSSDGQLYVSVDAFSAFGYEINKEYTVLQPAYQDNIMLIDRPRNADSTEGNWIVSSGGKNSTVDYGERDENGVRKKIGAQYGALCWKNWNGELSDQERYRLNFDVSGYNSLTFRLLSVGDNLLRVYGDGQELWLTSLDDGKQISSVTIDVSGIDTISFGGEALSKSVVKDGYVLILNPVLDTRAIN